ncbi:hypothetical protein J2S09_001537 [Bacillus fengqiuensis]|nr:hypothetical protein [Bacillus fengqiuensis]
MIKLPFRLLITAYPGIKTEKHKLYKRRGGLKIDGHSYIYPHTFTLSLINGQ